MHSHEVLAFLVLCSVQCFLCLVEQETNEERGSKFYGSEDGQVSLC